MLDIKFIRQNPEKVKEGCKKKGADIDVDKLLEIDKKRREILKKVEEIRAQKNKASKEIVKLKGKEREELLRRMKEIGYKTDIRKKLPMFFEEIVLLAISEMSSR
mgnify:CR=1 FL=1